MIPTAPPTQGSRQTMHAYSLQRSTILGLVVFVHGMLGLLLLAPPIPRSGATPARRRPHDGGHHLILVFLKSRAAVRAPRATAARPPIVRTPARHRPPPPSRMRALPPRTTAAAHRKPRTPSLTLSLPRVPAPVAQYIPGGRAFQQRLRAMRRRRQRRLLPDHRVPGMPHFAMRDPRAQGWVGALHAVTRVLGAQDPACVRAGTEIAMSKRQRARRHISLQQVRQTIFEHRCVLRPAGWMAPQGPATHLTVGPPGHGVP